MTPPEQAPTLHPRFYGWAVTATASLAHRGRHEVGRSSSFQAAKNETRLDHYQVRRYDSWYRHATLSMLALAFVAVTAAQKGHQGPTRDPGRAWPVTGQRITAKQRRGMTRRTLPRRRRSCLH